MRKEEWFDGGGGRAGASTRAPSIGQRGREIEGEKMKEMEKWSGSVGFGVIRGRRLCLVWCNKGGI